MTQNTSLLAENQGLRAALLAAQAEVERLKAEQRHVIETLVTAHNADIERLQGIINQQAELIRKYEIDNRQLEHLLQHYKGLVEKD